MQLTRCILWYEIGDILAIAYQDQPNQPQAQRDIEMIIKYHLYRDYFLHSDVTTLQRHQWQLFIRLQLMIRKTLSAVGEKSVFHQLQHCQCNVIRRDLCIILT